MYCRRCMYELHGLPGDRCPECGTSFDPGNPATFRKTLRRGWGPLSDWRASMVWLGALYVPVGLLAHFTTYAVAWASLGHLPRRYLDDPRDIGPAVDFAGALTNNYCGLFPYPVVLNVVGLILVAAARDRETAPSWKALVLVSLIGWVGGMGAVATIGRYVLTWFAD